MKTQYSNSLLRKLLFLGLSLIGISLNAQIIADGDYVIFSSVHNEAITAPNEPDYDAFMTTPNVSDINQVWTFTHLGNDIYTIQNMETGNYLGLKDNWCGQFGDVQGKFQATDDNIAFRIASGGTTDTYVIEIGFTNCGFGSVNNPIRAWDIQDGASGAQIQTFDVDINNVNQQFQIFSPALLSVNNFNSQNDLFFVYPNPAKELLTIQFGEKFYSSVLAEIINIQGQVVMTKKFTDNRIDGQINISNLRDGFYFLRLVDKDDRMLLSKKIIISNR
ncbi:T9SS type A sorting domain-containing protein [Aquimarina sp. M1]